MEKYVFVVLICSSPSITLIMIAFVINAPNRIHFLLEIQCPSVSAFIFSFALTDSTSFSINSTDSRHIDYSCFECLHFRFHFWKLWWKCLLIYNNNRSFVFYSEVMPSPIRSAIALVVGVGLCLLMLVLQGSCVPGTSCPPSVYLSRSIPLNCLSMQVILQSLFNQNHSTIYINMLKSQS